MVAHVSLGSPPSRCRCRCRLQAAQVPLTEELLIAGLLLLLLSFMILSADAQMLITGTSGRRHRVVGAGGLRRMLQRARPGDQLILQNGIYHGPFVVRRQGLSAAPILLTGSRMAVLVNPNGPALVLAYTRFWHLRGFSVRNAKKGILLIGARNNYLDRLRISHTHEEGVVFRNRSVKNVLRDSHISVTGMRTPERGQGIAVGSPVSSGDYQSADQCNRNQIVNNRFGPGIYSEAITVYGGSCCGYITDNTFDAVPHRPQQSSLELIQADAWVTLRGDRWLVRGNAGRASRGVDGFRVLSSLMCQMTNDGANGNFIYPGSQFMRPGVGGGFGAGGYPGVFRPGGGWGPYADRVGAQERQAIGLEAGTGNGPAVSMNGMGFGVAGMGGMGMGGGWGAINGMGGGMTPASGTGFMPDYMRGCGCENIFAENDCEFLRPSAGYCIRITNGKICANQYSNNNRVTGGRLVNLIGDNRVLATALTQYSDQGALMDGGVA